MNFQMMRVISSPSISTTGFFTLIFAIVLSLEPQRVASASFSVLLGRIAADVLA